MRITIFFRTTFECQAARGMKLLIGKISRENFHCLWRQSFFLNSTMKIQFSSLHANAAVPVRTLKSLKIKKQFFRPSSCGEMCRWLAFWLIFEGEFSNRKTPHRTLSGRLNCDESTTALTGFHRCCCSIECEKVSAADATRRLNHFHSFAYSLPHNML